MQSAATKRSDRASFQVTGDRREVDRWEGSIDLTLSVRLYTPPCAREALR